MLLAALAPVSAAAACSSNGQDTNGAGGASTSASGAGGGGGSSLAWWCLCDDGSAATVHTSPETTCATACGDAGVASYVQQDAVAGTPECDAYCAKIASLNCPGATCDPQKACLIGAFSCPAATQAILACVVQSGSFECMPGGGVTTTSHCGTYTDLCGTADAGTD